ncbi:hypothetical protein [Achromobacter marplatensis]|uniref:hypothetical protein n=1 Tax=Achromobacter marplatensis TaxID=470868 RepID=UPI0028E317C7|nr:hypothetical protein [Achromobacter marplatensis]
MSVQTCTSPSPSFRPLRQPAQPAPSPTSAVKSAPTENGAVDGASPRGWLGKLWAAYCRRREASRLRNLAVDMDPHILQDVGAPSWLVNETTLQRDLARLKHTDYMRW